MKPGGRSRKGGVDLTGARMDEVEQAADETAYESQFMTDREIMVDYLTSAVSRLTKAAGRLTNARIAAHGTPFEMRIVSVRDAVERLTGELQTMIDRASDEGSE